MSLGTEGSIAGDGQLVLKGKYGPKHIEALLRKYISRFYGLLLVTGVEVGIVSFDFVG